MLDLKGKWLRVDVLFCWRVGCWLSRKRLAKRKKLLASSIQTEENSKPAQAQGAVAVHA